MKYFLIKEKNCWADEFDIEAIRIVSATSEEEIYKSLLNNLKRECGDFPIELYFGTNEYLDFSSEKEVLDSLTCLEISEDEFETLQYVLGTEPIGVETLLSFLDSWI